MNAVTKGFSLMELVLVLAIIAVISAIVMPRYTSSLARYRADLAARRIASDLSLAQSRARALSTSQTVTFAPSSGAYKINSMPDPDRPAQVFVIDLTTDPYRATLDSATFGTGSSVTFNGFGMPDNSGTVMLHVGAVKKTVSVDADSGVATWQ
jgi:prepilin-type N-terminal cleavage/methylation domain-containing protein